MIWLHNGLRRQSIKIGGMGGKFIDTTNSRPEGNVGQSDTKIGIQEYEKVAYYYLP